MGRDKPCSGLGCGSVLPDGVITQMTKSLCLEGENKVLTTFGKSPELEWSWLGGIFTNLACLWWEEAWKTALHSFIFQELQRDLFLPTSNTGKAHSLWVFSPKPWNKSQSEKYSSGPWVSLFCQWNEMMSTHPKLLTTKAPWIVSLWQFKPYCFYQLEAWKMSCLMNLIQGYKILSNVIKCQLL